MSTPTEPQEPTPEDREGVTLTLGADVPEFYTDAVAFAVMPFTTAILFGQATHEGMKPHVRIRMSPEHAKVLAMMLKRAVKQHETNFNVQIGVSPELMNQFGLSLHDDWI